MSVRTRQAFRNSFGSSVPVIAPLYSARCETWALHEDGTFSCGSDSGCALHLNIVGVEPLHCCFQLQNGTLIVRRERGRIWVNDLPVSTEMILSPGDVLTLGPVSFSVDASERKTTAPIDVVSHAPLTHTASPAVSSAPVAMESNRVDVAHLAPVAAPPVVAANEELLKAIEFRERQLQDRAAILEERERLVLERQHAQEERAKFLSEQKALVEQHQQSFASTEATLRKQKDDLDQRVRSIADREQRLARQMEDSAQAYAKLEASRLKLNDELERVAQREAAVAERSEELKLASKEAEERRLQLIQDQDAATRLKSEVAAREAGLLAETERLQQHEAELQRLSAELVARRLELETAQNHSLAETAEVRALLEFREQAAAQLQQRLTEVESLRASDCEQLLSIQHSVEEASRRLAEKSNELSSANERLLMSESLVQELRSQLEIQQRQIEELQNHRPEDSSRSHDTRTVEQLAAIASEREAALRARQEAFVVQKQIQEAREKLSADEARLQRWQAEIEQRYREVADRVVTLKAAIREANDKAARLSAVQPVITESFDYNALQAERESLAAERQSLQTFRDELSARDAELRAAESRIAELEDAARSVQRAAETEREALAASHRDLLFERNAHQQRSQDLVSRETGLHEREILVARQTEELRSRFEAINQQTTELRRYEAELHSRAAELHRQILDWKTESRAESSAPSTDKPSAHSSSGGGNNNSLTLGQLTEELRELSGQNDSLVAEREALMTAIRELQKALQDARADVEEASRIKAASTKQEQAIAQLYQQIEERSNQLQLSESRFHQLLEELEETRQHLKQAYEQTPSRENSVAGDTTADVTDSHDQSSDVLEAQLLSQIESLRSELNTSAAQNTSRQSEYTSLISDRDSRIRELEESVSRLQQELNQRRDIPVQVSSDMTSDQGVELDALRDRLEKAEHVLQDRDDLIRELRSRLMQQSRPETATAAESSGSADRDSLQSEARELDRRAQLLDDREEEIRERSRRLEQSEEEVEAQRRQLLDARQQLEIARAEIQVAMKQHSASQLPPAVPAEPFAAAASAKSTASELAMGLSSELAEREQTSFSFGSAPTMDDGSSATDLRSELASLFGLKKHAPEPPPIPSSSGPLVSVSDFVDLTEATGQAHAVALKFGQDASSLVEAAPTQAPAEAEPAREENSDDFVRDYMEQLLARSRKSAGNALPSELKSSETKKSEPGPQPASAPVKKTETAAGKKEGPKVKSFIEQYMAGGFGDLTGEGTFPAASSSVPEPSAENEDVSESEPRAPRQKIDLQKLREDMDSFRTLSTQSVENALVDHAIRRERHSINGRIMFVAVLVVMTIFLAVANLKGIINQPSITWVCMVAAIGAGAELARKYMSLKARCRVGLQGECPEEVEGQKSVSEDAEVRRILNEEKAAMVEPAKPRPVASLELDEEMPTRESSERFLLQEDDEHERSRYFEL